MIYQFKIVLFASCIISTLCFPNNCGPSNTEVSSSEIPDNDHRTVFKIIKTQVKDELSLAAHFDNGLIVYQKLYLICLIKYGINIREGIPDHIYVTMKNDTITMDEAMATFHEYINIKINNLADDLRKKANNGYINALHARDIFVNHGIDKEIRRQTLYKMKLIYGCLLKCEALMRS
ncbi:uncharacterized protein LOC126894075 isoform X2 [Daktulosphaira vitifoliae]|uniref:uncharacterized protein LOC126894075 isoform X2 n=1 Tax=Daktulosphaira vitifoliae TaxID=58002 RepID=UPI0021A99A5E|nr:uncharacterized protein LOC126894075 isoform X2 [Daktulosphaira vitifoliae]